MTFQEFDKFQLALFDEVTKMRDTKGKEYTDGVDRFQNFNEEAKDMDVDRLKVAEIFLNKHMRAIKSYIRTGKIHSTESIRGRFVDAITYLTLIAGMIEESAQLESINLNKAELSRVMDDFKFSNAGIAGIATQQKDQNSGKHQPFEFDPTISIQQPGTVICVCKDCVAARDKQVGIGNIKY